MKVIAILDQDEGFGAILELAGLFGWKDGHGDASEGEDGWTPDDADACEEDALDYLQSKGVMIVEIDSWGLHARN